MKPILLSLILFFLSGPFQESIYDFNITSLEGENISLGSARGKKIMIVVLPVNETTGNTIFLAQLDSISRAHGENAVLIAVPSYEEGFSNDIRNNVKEWYESFLNERVIITQGYHTHKSSGAEQDGLLSWLTHKDKNGHFDNEVSGTGQKYFINESGELYAVYGPEVPLNSKAIQRIFQ